MTVKQDENTLNKIFLSHQRARWVLMHFHSQSGETVTDLEALLKSLEKLGVPFAPDELSRIPHVEDKYLYENLMELLLIITLRTQGYDARDLGQLIVKYREPLRKIFRRAFLERRSGLGAPRRLFVSKAISNENKNSPPEMVGQIELTTIRGIYLDLKIHSARGRPPEIISLDILGPEDAVTISMTMYRNIYPRTPLPITNMAEDLVRIASGPFPAITGDHLTLLK